MQFTYIVRPSREILYLLKALVKHESPVRVKRASVLGTDNRAADAGGFYEGMPCVGADIRKAVDLLLGVSLKEERFSQEREWDSGTWFVEKFGEVCRSNR